MKQNLEFPLVHQYFETICKKSPSNIAVIDEQGEWTYTQLDQFSNQLARFLIQLDLPKQTYIGVLTQPTRYFVASILAIWKANHVYVPFPTDGTVPKERLEYYLHAAQPKLILTDLASQKNPICKEQYTVCIEKQLEQISKHKTTTLDNTYSLEDLAYIIFSSGSTGDPKGVMVSHRGLYNTFTENIRILSVSSNDIVALFASKAFDAHLMEIFTALLAGAKLFLLPEGIKTDIYNLKQAYTKQRVTVGIFTPSMLQLLRPDEFPDMRIITSTGEKVTTAVIEKWLKSGITITNGYGPTEVSICTSVGLITDPNIIHCGKPIAGLHVFILKDGVEAQNEQGELYISGYGLAKGYLNNDKLTNECFPTITINKTPLRTFRTGDIGCIDHDGNILILGRKNRQVKIHGQLFHPNEVEKALEKNDFIESAYASALVNEQGIPAITAYLHTKRNISNETLRHLHHRLQKSLPTFMLPNGWVVLHDVSYSLSKKIDWKSCIKQSDTPKRIRHPANIAPRDEIEKILLGIWIEVLGDVGKDDGVEDSFLYRGSSIQCATFVLLVNYQKEFNNFHLSLADFLSSPTISSVGRLIRAHLNNPEEILVQLHPLHPIKAIHNTPLFLIHSLMGDAQNDYRELIKYWPKEIPIIGLNSPGLKNSLSSSSDIKEIAKIYIKAIRKEYPNGPIIIAGWSLGGLIGYEIVRQLQSDSTQAALIAVDSVFFSHWQNSTNASHSKYLIGLLEKSLLPLIQKRNATLDLAILKEKSNIEQILTLFSEDLFNELKNSPQRKNLAINIRNLLVSVQIHDASEKIDNAIILTTTNTVNEQGDDKSLGWWFGEAHPTIEGEHTDHWSIFCEPQVVQTTSKIRKLFLEYRTRFGAEKIIQGFKAHYIEGWKDTCIDILNGGTPRTYTPNNHTFFDESQNSPADLREILKKHKRSLIRSEPFMGSTTYSKNLCYEWAMGNLLAKEFEIIIRIDLQEIASNTNNIRSLSDIFTACYSRYDYLLEIPNMKPLVEYIDTFPNKVLFILDNWRGSLIRTPSAKLLESYFNKSSNTSSVLILTRNNIQPKIPTEITIKCTGLTEEGTNEYINAFFYKNKRQQKIAAQFLKLNHSIKPSLRNPFFLTRFCEAIKNETDSIKSTNKKDVSLKNVINFIIDNIWKLVIENINHIELGRELSESTTGILKLIEKTQNALIKLSIIHNQEHGESNITHQELIQTIEETFSTKTQAKPIVQFILESGLIIQNTTNPLDGFRFLSNAIRDWHASLSSPTPTTKQECELWNFPTKLYEPNIYVERQLKITELEDLIAHQLQSKNVAYIKVDGLSGSGKTLFLLHYILEKKQSYKHIYWFHAGYIPSDNNKFPDTPIEILYKKLAIEKGLIDKNDTYDKAREKLVAWFNNNPGYLLIFDDVLEYNHIKSYLPNSGGVILLSSTNPHWPALGKFHITLDEFSMEHSLKLLELFEIDVSLDLETEQKLIAELGSLPLAIAQVAAYRTSFPFHMSAKEYLTEFRTSKELLANNAFEDDSHKTIASTWEITFSRVKNLDPRGLELLDQLAYLDGQNIAACVIDKLLAPHKNHLNKIIQTLARFSILKGSKDTHNYSVHKLLLRVIREKHDNEKRKTIVNSLAYMLSLASRLEHENIPIDSTLETLCLSFLPHAMILNDYLAELPEQHLSFVNKHALNISIGFTQRYINNQAIVAIPYLERCVTFCDLEQPGQNTILRLQASHQLALSVLQCRNDGVTAIDTIRRTFEQILEILKKLPDPQLAWREHNIKLIVACLQKDLTHRSKLLFGLLCDQKHFYKSHDNLNDWQIGVTILNLGNTYGDIGQIEDSALYIKEAYDRYKIAFGVRQWQTIIALDCLAIAYLRNHQPELALSSFNQLVDYGDSRYYVRYANYLIGINQFLTALKLIEQKLLKQIDRTLSYAEVDIDYCEKYFSLLIACQRSAYKKVVIFDTLLASYLQSRCYFYIADLPNFLAATERMIDVCLSKYHQKPITWLLLASIFHTAEIPETADQCFQYAAKLVGVPNAPDRNIDNSFLKSQIRFFKGFSTNPNPEAFRKALNTHYEQVALASSSTTSKLL